MDAWELRHRIYDHFVRSGEAPSAATVDAWVGRPERARALLAELHRRHMLVLDEEGRIRMALPFSGVSTPYRVSAGERRWYANCAWDAIALPIVLDVDATIEAPWLDSGEVAEMAVVDGTASPAEGLIHFAIPARHWWDDIVET